MRNMWGRSTLVLSLIDAGRSLMYCDGVWTPDRLANLIIARLIIVYTIEEGNPSLAYRYSFSQNLIFIFS